MYPSSRQVALLFAVMLKRSGKTRARVSEKTYRSLCARSTLREAFTLAVRNWLEDFGVLVVKLERGGFALVTIAALEGAPSLMAKGTVAAERKALLAGKLDEEKLMDELGLDVGEDEE